MAAPISRIWASPMPDVRSKLRASVDRGCKRCTAPVKVFFRADDVGAPSLNFTRLLELFTAYRIPLALAVVPAWLTGPRWRHLRSIADTHAELWCWHQHGWRHANHEPVGKKSEFGPGRTDDGILSDLKRGRERLKKIMGNFYFPVFTPPWNRCDRRTLGILQELGFLAVSRSAGGLPVSLNGLPDLCVHVDLHTRKGQDTRVDESLLFHEIEQEFSDGCCGIMLHHRSMNGSAFEFLETLLEVLREHPLVETVMLQEMV